MEHPEALGQRSGRDYEEFDESGQPHSEVFKGLSPDTEHFKVRRTVGDGDCLARAINCGVFGLCPIGDDPDALQAATGLRRLLADFVACETSDPEFAQRMMAERCNPVDVTRDDGEDDFQFMERVRLATVNACAPLIQYIVGLAISRDAFMGHECIEAAAKLLGVPIDVWHQGFASVLVILV